MEALRWTEDVIKKCVRYVSPETTKKVKRKENLLPAKLSVSLGKRQDKLYQSVRKHGGRYPDDTKTSNYWRKFCRKVKVRLVTQTEPARHVRRLEFPTATKKIILAFSQTAFC